MHLALQQRGKSVLSCWYLDGLVSTGMSPVLSSPHPVPLTGFGLCLLLASGKTRTFSRMAHRFNLAGHPVYTVPLGAQLGCIKQKARTLSSFLDKHNLDDGEPIFLDNYSASYVPHDPSI